MANAANTAGLTEDEVRLAKMGYKQEFKRGLTAFHNFGISFSHISILIGIAPLVGFVMVAGGPASAVWGWLIVGGFAMTVCSAMAEICSAYPTAGGLYYWSAKLGGDTWGPFFAWLNGWMNIAGEIGGITGACYQVSLFIYGLIAINHEFEYKQGYIVAINLGVMVLAGLVNSVSDRTLAIWTNFSVGVHVFGSLAIFITLLATAPTRQSAKWLFTEVVDLTGWNNYGLAFMIGFLLPGYTFIGYDASAHLSEETQSSHTAASKGMIHSMIWSIVGGWLLVIAYFACIQNYEQTLTTPYGFPVVQILVDCAGQVGGTILLLIITLGSFCCVVSAITANSRMMYSFSRDGALPKFFYWTHSSTKLPLRTIWLSCTVCYLLSLISLGTPIALFAFNSVGTIGLNTAYVIPVFVRLTFGKDKFKQAEFNLGRFSVLIGWIAVFWVAFLFVLLCLPQVMPVTAQNMNYASLMLGAVLIYTGISWMASARKWFKGPISQVSEEELAHMEAALKGAPGEVAESAEVAKIAVEAQQ
ncbi:amino acid/polyamine transporter I [Hyaloraphidium curvatum]|nr:amino acid/polyamine transporter I [Hyaloraphidium curvatum]